MNVHSVHSLAFLILVSFCVVGAQRKRWKLKSSSSSEEMFPEPTCGTSRTGYIIGGTEARQGQYPWAVSLRDAGTNKHFCGGVLISDRTVITAAHCIYRINKERRRILRQPETIKAVVGGHYLDKVIRGERSMSVKFVKPHTGFDFRRSFDYNYDIAMVVLQHSATAFSSASPACLPDQPSELPAEDQLHSCYVFGWGATEDYWHPNPQPSNVLMHAPIDYLVSREKCLHHWEDFIDNTTFCAGSSSLQNLMGPCKGDSGSGLVCPNAYGGLAFSLEGIVSRGAAQCMERPAIFTRIAKTDIWEWIRDTKDMESKTGLGRCLLPIIDGHLPCRKRSEVTYAYSVAQKECIVLKFTGCEGNDNRFPSFEECARICGPWGVRNAPWSRLDPNYRAAWRRG